MQTFAAKAANRPWPPGVRAGRWIFVKLVGDDSMLRRWLPGRSRIAVCTLDTIVRETGIPSGAALLWWAGWA